MILLLTFRINYIIISVVNVNWLQQVRMIFIFSGTHDLDKIQGPFIYDAQAPSDIVFQALRQSKEMNAVELFKVFENDLQLKSYLPIIKDSPVYPVVMDSQKRVLSLPPIINSEFSKISIDTKNIFIESTCVLIKYNYILD